ncbi:MAG: methionyl-tRNA formyltransferase [Treponema sp.]|jgi:methionyl-tRNA formyltransferase|nr:methionyl-tRNA formyltransferase [Treponema sp.]
MRIVYAGSPAIAVPALESLAALALEGADTPGCGAEGGAGGFELAGVLTNPDSPRGRSGKPEPTEVAAAALALAGRFERARRQPPAILKPERLGGAARGEVGALRPDLLVSFAYGRIFGPKFLALFPLGGINVHPSLLPAYRGPAPIPQAILNGDRETGISVQRLALETDCGDILAQEAVPLAGRETAASLGAEMARRAALLLPGVVRDIAEGRARGRPQDPEKASFCGLLSRGDGRIDWNMSARRIEAQIRAYTPWPLSWTTDGDRRLYIRTADLPEGGAVLPGTRPPGTVLGVDKERGILVQTGDGVLALVMLQYEAKKALEWRAFLNGARNFIGRRLGENRIE